jgi:hypothetical protein
MKVMFIRPAELAMVEPSGEQMPGLHARRGMQSYAEALGAKDRSSWKQIDNLWSGAENGNAFEVIAGRSW